MNRPEIRFAVVANGRSGSTLLANLIRSHPAIQCENEILNEKRWQGIRRPLGWLVRRLPTPYLARLAEQATKPVFGFKLKTGRQVYDLSGTLYSLHRHGWRLIALQRRDALQQTFSWAVAQATGHWQRTAHGQTPLQRVTLDPDHFLRDLRICLADRQTLTKLLQPLPHLALIYEDDLQHSDQWPATAARLCTFLSVPPAPLTSRIIKTWDRPYAEVVTNYDELVRLAKREAEAQL